MFDRIKNVINNLFGKNRKQQQQAQTQNQNQRRSLPIPKIKGGIRIPKFGGKKLAPPPPRIESTSYPTSRTHPREI